MNAAQAKNLRVFFSKGKEVTWALRGIDFVLPLGGSLALIGESGSGKTTLLRALLGLVAPSEGEALLFDTDLSSAEAAKRKSVRRRCGYIAQDPYGSLPPTLSVEDAVAEVWQLVHGSTEEAKEKATSLLEELNIEREMFKSSLRDGLSGGQRQRVAIARALVLEPELLLADEPTSMQDASTRWDVLEVLKRRIKRGMALLFVTHDLLLARKPLRGRTQQGHHRKSDASLHGSARLRPATPRQTIKSSCAATRRAQKRRRLPLLALLPKELRQMCHLTAL